VTDLTLQCIGRIDMRHPVGESCQMSTLEVMNYTSEGSVSHINVFSPAS
jgi:hypothetical protein